MAQEGKLDRFDSHLPASQDVNPWQADGSFRCDFELLERLLSVAVGTDQRSGIVAGAADVWAAEQLRRAGFDPDEVWPRRRKPRVMPRDVRNFIDLALTRRLRDEVEGRFDKPGARRALPAEAHVMGRAYSKQSDVVIASWAAGVELMISTKTMLSSYQKNLRNRFEEGYGDAKNLRGRHPLAALGFLFITAADIPADSLSFAQDMLRKLTSEPDVYDCSCLLVIEGAEATVEVDEPDARGVDDEPPSLVPRHEQLDADTENIIYDSDQDGPPGRSTGKSIRVQRERASADLDADQFFELLISRALDRMPLGVYSGVRDRRAVALRPE